MNSNLNTHVLMSTPKLITSKSIGMSSKFTLPKSTISTYLKVANDWRKKTILNDELLKKLSQYLNEEEMQNFNILAKKLTFEDMNNIFNKIIKERCVQKH